MLRDMNETERHNGSPASLFDELPAVEEQQVIAAKQARAASRRQGPPRLLQPNRGQIELRARTWSRCWVRITGLGWCGATSSGRT